MHSQREQYLYLLRKHIDGQLSDDEIMLLDHLTSRISKEEQEELFEIIWQEQAIDHASPLFTATEKGDILSRIFGDTDYQTKPKETIHTRSRMLVIARYVTAAVVIISLGLGILLYKPHSTDISHATTALSVTADDIQPGGNRAVLLTEGGDKIDLDNPDVGIINTSGSFSIVRLKSGEIQYKINSVPTTIQRHTVVTPRGGHINFLLPDGSKVWLNSESSLTFTSDMSQSDRIVEMTGEAYFEVAKRQGQRFLVHSNFGKVEVLGTKFNINSYNPSKATTALLEGSIRLETVRISDQMTPHQIASISDDGRITKETDADIYKNILWTKGFFHFDHEDVYSIGAELSRWYAIDVEIKSKNVNREFTGTVSRDLKLSQMIEMLEYLGIKCNYSNNKLIII